MISAGNKEFTKAPTTIEKKVWRHAITGNAKA
jgi:hypothetical protein